MNTITTLLIITATGYVAAGVFVAIGVRNLMAFGKWRWYHWPICVTTGPVRVIVMVARILRQVTRGKDKMERVPFRGGDV